MTYQAIYKCRLCGKTFENIDAWEDAAHRFDYFWDGKKKSEGQSDLIDFVDTGLKRHHCTDGSIGIADFQGFKAVGKCSDKCKDCEHNYNPPCRKPICNQMCADYNYYKKSDGKHIWDCMCISCSNKCEWVKQTFTKEQWDEVWKLGDYILKTEKKVIRERTVEE